MVHIGHLKTLIINSIKQIKLPVAGGNGTVGWPGLLLNLWWRWLPNPASLWTQRPLCWKWSPAARGINSLGLEGRGSSSRSRSRSRRVTGGLDFLSPSSSPFVLLQGCYDGVAFSTIESSGGQAQHELMTLKSWAKIIPPFKLFIPAPPRSEYWKF